MANDKLELFEQKIMQKAAAERAEILRLAQEAKRAELEKEESRLLEELYHKMQEQISEIKTNNIKEISHETLALKKELYRQRERYVDEMLARTRAGLVSFAGSADYEAFLLKKIESFAGEYKFDGSIIKVRSADLPFADKIKAIYGDCTVEADDASVAIGGAILLNRRHGIEVDLSLDQALDEQRAWFYNQSSFSFE